MITKWLTNDPTPAMAAIVIAAPEVVAGAKYTAVAVQSSVVASAITGVADGVVRQITDVPPDAPPTFFNPISQVFSDFTRVTIETVKKYNNYVEMVE